MNAHFEIVRIEDADPRETMAAVVEHDGKREIVPIRISGLESLVGASERALHDLLTARARNACQEAVILLETRLGIRK